MGSGAAFPPETLRALFDAVEINDVVDPELPLPDPVDLACPQERFRRCFDLALQFWSEGAGPAEMARLVGVALRHGDLSPEQRVRYKHIRARCKQLRFALVLYGAAHKTPPLFRVTVAAMGHLQDGFRNGHRRAVLAHGTALRVLLSRPVAATVERGIRATPLDSAEGFAAWRKAQIDKARQTLRRDQLSGHEFHALRKIMSRENAFYGASQVLYPGEQNHRMFRFLSAINGMMGARHDELVEQAISGEQAYQDPRALPDEIRRQLEMLLARYPA